MKKLICLLFGLNKDVFESLKPSQRGQYYTKLLSLILSVCSAAFLAIDVYHSLNGGRLDLKVIPITLIWMFLVGTLDTILIRSKNLSPYFRLVFTVGVVSISLLSVLNLLFYKDVKNSFLAENNKNIKELKESYLSDRESRYNPTKIMIKDIESEMKNYNNNVLIPESHRGGALTKHTNKKVHYDNLGDKILKIDSIFTVKEAPFKAKYEAELKTLNAFDIKNVGFLRSLKRTLTIVLNDPFYSFIAFTLMCVLLAFETVVFFNSLNFDHSPYEKEESKWFETNNNHRELIHMANVKHQKINQQLMHQSLEDFYLMSQNINLLDQIKNLNEQSNNNPIINSLVQQNQQKVIDIFSEKNDHNNVNIKGIFSLNQSMKELAAELMVKASGDRKQFAKLLFEWCVENLNYQDSHNLKHYKSASEIYNAKVGICGELSIFYLTMMRYLKIDCNYVTVNKDFEGKVVNHACVSFEGVLIDIAYKKFGVIHKEFKILSEEELRQNFKNWNKN